MFPIPISLIIFDLDGTLIDSKSAIVSSVNLMLKQLGLPKLSAPKIVSYIGHGVKQLVRDSLGLRANELFEQAYKIYWKNLTSGVERESRLFPGVKPVLSHFKDKQLVVVSNSAEEVIRSVLKKRGIQEYFTAVFGGDDEMCLKPSACQIECALETLKIERRRCMMVGDMAIDVLAGKAAGVFTCGVTYGIGKKGDIKRAGPDFMIDDIKKLIKIIE
jgi:HAD superfamily hydrolase (TIGR01549 family)